MHIVHCTFTRLNIHIDNALFHPILERSDNDQNHVKTTGCTHFKCRLKFILQSLKHSIFSYFFSSPFDHCLFTMRLEFKPQTDKQFRYVEVRISLLQVSIIKCLSDFRKIYTLLVISLNTSLVLITKEGNDENLGLVWNINSLSDWVRTFFYFLFFIIASVLKKIFVSID